MIIKNNDISSIDKIYEKIYKIESLFKFELVISILFHNDVKFVNPLFFILLLNLHDKYKHLSKVLVIDIIDLDYSLETIQTYTNNNKLIEKNLLNGEKKSFKFPKKDSRQHYIHRILLQFLDSGYIIKKPEKQIKNHYINDYVNDYVNSIYNIEDREKKYKKNIPKEIKNYVFVNEATNETEYKTIFLYYSRHHQDSLFQKDEQFRHLLPIFKLSNFPTYILNTFHYDNKVDEGNKRNELYKDLLLDTSDENYRDNFEKSFNKVFNAIKPSNSQNIESLIPPLKNLIFECIDNIKKHTDGETNSYFCFYHDPINKQFKLIIYDDYDEGFLNTYEKTLKEELDVLETALDVKELSDDISTYYNEDIKDLEKVKDFNENYLDIKILTKLFDKKGTFETHQIPRIVMHFGIPTLMRIINEVGGIFSIKLHRTIDEDNRLYYHINSSKDKIEPPSRYGLNGTHIYVEIPDNSEYTIRQPQPLYLNDKDLIVLHNKEEVIEEEIKQFVPLTEENKTDSKSPHRTFDFNNYMKKNPTKTISDFLRDLYFYSYKYNVLDALVTNFPISQYESYLQNLVYILFSKENVNQEFVPLNVVFFNKSSVDIVFVGGKNYAEFIASNKLITEHYGHYKHQITDVPIEHSNEETVKAVRSKFFFPIEDSFIVLPFELYEDNKLTIERLIINNLNENKRYLHVDVGKGYHISNFYRFDLIFQNSRFIDRIVLKFLDFLESSSNNKFKFIGIGKYSSLLLATLHKVLQKDISDEYKVIYDLTSKEEQVSLNDYIDKNKKDYTFVIYLPVIFDGELVKEKIINKYEDCSFLWLNSIMITLEDEDKIPPSVDRYTITNLLIDKNSYFKVNDESGCDLCRGENELPLYKINKKDYFLLENCYFGSYEKKTLMSHTKVKDIKWADSIHFGHIKRDNNHYAYYTKSLQLFYKNFDNKIKNYLSDIVNNKIEKLFALQNKKIVIMTPMHGTHNKFITMVNSLVFSNKATILQFDISKGDTNIYRDIQEVKYSDDTLFFYVDDEISSGSTIEYFYTLLKTFNRSLEFSGVIILIDRMTRQDEKFILKYISNPTESVFTFTKLEIKPIKTTKFEECFLCKRKEEYKEILNNTVLDINRFQIAKKISKLSLEDHTQIDFCESKQNNNCINKSFVNKIKNYIKMAAIDYVYEYFDKFSINHLERNYKSDFNLYIKLEKSFTEYIFNNIKSSFIYNINTEEILKEICELESGISLLKAMSFPKIVYYESMRYLTTIVIIRKIRLERDKNPIDKRFDEKVLKELIGSQENEFNKSFLEYYKSKLNLDYMNFLFTTAGYLHIHNILNIENIEYYYNAAAKVKEEELDHILLQPYLFAIKMTTQYSIDKSSYLESQINRFFENRQKEYDEYTLIDALIIENNLTVSKKIKGDMTFYEVLNNILGENKYSVQQKIELSIESIKEVLDKNYNNDKKEIRIENIFINENIHTEYKDYENYIDNIKFIDIVNNFEQPNGKELQSIERVVKGALSANKSESIKIKRDSQTHEIEKIDNTWSNIYVDNFFINGEEKNCVLIKLVDINMDKLDNTLCPKAIDNIWYKPVGCIVVSFDGQKENFLDISKIILSIQRDFVDFIKEEFSHETFREILRRKDHEELMKEMKRHHAWQITRINHSVKDYINLSPKITTYLKHKQDRFNCKEYLKMLGNYTYGLEHLSSIVSAEPSKSEEDKKKVDIFVTLREGTKFNTQMKEFIKISHDFNDKLSSNCKNINLDITKLKRNSLVLELDETIHMAHICFEFIFNAIKNTGDSIKNPTIKFYSMENDLEGIIIENSIDGSTQEKRNSIIEKINSSLESKAKTGLPTIERILTKQNYKLIFETSSTNLIIKIRKEIRNVE